MRVLAIGAHPDDVELGCGGTLAKHVARGDTVTVIVGSDGGKQPGANEVDRGDEALAATDRLGARLVWLGMADGGIEQAKELIEVLDLWMKALQPDVVYGHPPNDSHQDHRAMGWATLAAARNHCRVLHFQSPTAIDFRPTIYVDISDTMQAKLDIVAEHASQVDSSLRVDLEAYRARAVAHGFEARVGYAEAFETPRFVWDFDV